VERRRILLAEPADFSPAALAILERNAEVVAEPRDADGMRRALNEFDAIWFRLGHRITAEMLGAGTRCRLLATPVTGLDHIDLEACARQGVRVVSLRGEVDFLRTVRATAELTVALMLGLMRRLVPAAGHVAGGGWNRDEFRGHELHGKVLGIVGMGRLGQIVAGYADAFGMDVIGFDPRPDYPAVRGRRADSLDDLLRESQIVSLHVSYGPSTRRLIGAREFALMRPDAVLINTARGGVIDEAALLRALDEQGIAGAALDVLADEPAIGTDHPLVRYAGRRDNLLLTPHIGGNTTESFEKTEVFLAGRVVAALGEMSA
jgi:D-3-phosphoglycerate dehydrogenase